MDKTKIEIEKTQLFQEKIKALKTLFSFVGGLVVVYLIIAYIFHLWPVTGNENKANKVIHRANDIIKIIPK